jgi:hypothetical protein
MGAASGIALCGTAAPTLGQCEATETSRAAPADCDYGDRFGHAVAISGPVAVMGAPHDGDAGPLSGSVYIYVYDGTSWVEQPKIAASGSEAEDYFGESVALSGNTVLIGARGDDDGGFEAGAAYVFRFGGTTWAQEAKLMASNADAMDLFGHSVAIGGNVAVVGAYQPVFGKGAAYVFSHDATGWNEEAILTASDGDVDDQFGLSVALSGNIALIGAHQDDDHGDKSGAAYVYRFNWSEAEWEEEAKLTASDAVPGAGFGYSVSLDGDVALIGANNDMDFNESGSAYVFRFNGATWVEEAKLSAPVTAPPDDDYGRSVAISGNVAIVGAQFDDAGGASSGAAYLYYFDGTEWTLRARLTASDHQSGDTFATAVAFDGETAFVGAPQDDPGGSVYVFNRLDDGMPDTCACPWDLDGSGGVGITDFLQMLTAWGPNPGHPADFDEDGEVAFDDFLVLLGYWGDCP